VHPGGSGTRFHQCGTCGLRFQQARPNEDGSIYQDVEVTREERGERGGPSLVLDRDALQHLRRYAPGRRLLDVGSGDGRFLQAAAATGFTATGTDVCPELAAMARERSGCEVLLGALPHLGLPGSSFDVINLDLVLMYVPDPVPLLVEVARLLAPGGVCRIRECFGDSLNARMQRERWWFYCDSTLRVYTRRSIRYLARQAGLEPLRWYAGTEVSLATWSAYAARKQKQSRGQQLLQFALKRGSLCGIPVAGDGTCYLRKR
jgi:SAM-dependent methyltransferase